MRGGRCLLTVAAAAGGILGLTAATTEFHLGNGGNRLSVSVVPSWSRDFTLDVYRAGQARPQSVTVGFYPFGRYAGGVMEGESVQRPEGPRKRPQRNRVTDSVVWTRGPGWFGFMYALLPHFERGVGLYDATETANSLATWLRDYERYPHRRFDFEFRYDAASDRLEAYLDGSYAGLAAATGALERVVVRHSDVTRVSGSSDAFADFALHRLGVSRHHARPALCQGARIVIDAAEQERIARDFVMWNPSESVDLGRARDKATPSAADRTPWLSGPEYFHWTVPAAFYAAAEILCAELPGESRLPGLGLSLTRYGLPKERRGNAVGVMSLHDPARAQDIQKVGDLEYRTADGDWCSTPVYRVRIDLAPFVLIAEVNGPDVYGVDGRAPMPRLLPQVGDYLDFELTDPTPSGFRSGVQVFGCSLRKADFAVEMVPSARGNRFVAGGAAPETGVRVTASSPLAKGCVRCTVGDPHGRRIACLEKPFSLTERGDAKLLSFDLSCVTGGWADLAFTFLDARGRSLGNHRASAVRLPATADPAATVRPDGYFLSRSAELAEAGRTVRARLDLRSRGEAVPEPAESELSVAPYAYPKPAETARATESRLLDRATPVRAVPTGGQATRAFEFRDAKGRTVTALWTEAFRTAVAVRFPEGASVRLVDAWGVETPVSADLRLEASAQPCFFVSDRPVREVALLGSVPDDLVGRTLRRVLDTAPAGLLDDPLLALSTHFRGEPDGSRAPIGDWEVTLADDPVAGTSANFHLTGDGGRTRRVVGSRTFAKPWLVSGGKDAPALAVRVRGNGGTVGLAVSRAGVLDGKPTGKRMLWGSRTCTFDGWRTVVLEPPAFVREARPDEEFLVVSVLWDEPPAEAPGASADDLRLSGVYEVRTRAPDAGLLPGEFRIGGPGDDFTRQKEGSHEEN